MTVSVQTAQTIALGDGVNTTFTFSFIGAIAADIQVAYTDTAGAITVLDPSQYTITLNAAGSNQLWGIGGSVVYPLSGSPIALGTTLTMTRMLPYVQEVTVINQGAFYPQAVEEALDLLELQIQQLVNIIDTGTTGSGAGNIVGPGTSSNYGVAYFIGTNGQRLGSTLAGTAGYVLTGRGTTDPPTFQLPPGEANGILSTVVYGPGTYVLDIPEGATLAQVQLQGGGGGGEGAAGAPGSGKVAVGSGGSGGGWVQALLTASSIDGQTLTVGDFGAGGAAGDNPGANGGNTTLLTYTAFGGLGGTLGTTSSAPPVVAHSMAGATATTSSGSYRVGDASGTELTTTTSAAFGGHGGGCFSSPPTSASTCGTNSQANGPNGTGPGGGGGGGVVSGTGTSASGGNGGSGSATITYYGFLSATASAIGEATQAQEEAGILGTVYTSPRNQQWHYSALKVEGYIAADGTILQGYNIASVSHSGTGTYVITFTNAMASTSYAAVATPDQT
jgi:hypothetical protein